MNRFRLLPPVAVFLLLASGLGPLVQIHAAESTAPTAPATVTEPVGLFDGQSDIGKILHTGKVVFDAGKQAYAVTGSGDNIWAKADNLHFVWKKMSGDVALSADLEFLPPPKDNPKPSAAHRKVVLMIRQSLDPDSAYVDASWHGDGMTALQFRETKAGASYEIRVSQAAPKRLRIEKHGDSFTFFIADQSGENPHFTGAGYTLKLTEPFYVGIGVCSQMKADGSEPMQLTNDDNNNNYFSSVSPTEPGVLLITTYPKDVKGTPDNTPILVRQLNANKTIGIIAKINGDAGTAPSWSQDGKYRAFVSRRWVYEN